MDRMYPVTSSVNGPFVLGMNFFWCAFVRYVVPPHPRKADPPHMSSSPPPPQRVLDSKGSVVGHEEAFKLYQGFPPRMFED
ncbi:hypothetical protein BD413DRAFT_612222 [Trametes elegans]|nr:hypothetical protein BD413DRAFT_612222 [Trametes elegans]